MNVLALTNLYPNPLQPTRGMFNRHQLRRLARRRPVRVIAPIAWTDELAGRRAARLRQGSAALPAGRQVVTDGITVDHPRYLFPPRVLRNWYGHFFRRSVRKTFERVLGEFRFDIVYAAWAYPDGWAAVDLAHSAGLPVVLKVHGSDVLMLSQFPGRQRRTAEALRRADAIVAVSRDLAHQVVRLGVDPARVHVIYDGIDVDQFRSGPPAEARARLGLPLGERIIVTIGNLVPVKAQDVLIKACAELARRGEQFSCHIIGHGPLKAALERQAYRLGLEGRVNLVGPLPHEQLPDWYRAADVFVLPSRSEGVPNVLLESVACGTPFVASRVGGIPEVQHPGIGRLVPPDDALALADALSESLADPPNTRGPGMAKHVEETVTELEALLCSTMESFRVARHPALRSSDSPQTSGRRPPEAVVRSGV